MRHYVTSLCLFVITAIFLFTACVLTCSAKMTQFLYDREAAIIVQRGDEALKSAEAAIRKSLDDAVIIATRTAYADITSKIYDNNIQITEDEANELFAGLYVDELKSIYNSSGNLSDGFEKLLQKIPGAALEMDRQHNPVFLAESDSVTVKDIAVTYKYGDSYKANITFDVSLPLRRIVLYDENPDFFEYSLVAGKGIYITGQTSTVFGNIYAGTHEPSESRKAEALYGEKDIYGGININATQLAVYSSKIVTDGILNMKGSFVIFGKDDGKTDIFAKDISQTDTIASRNIYEHTGIFSEINANAPEKEMIRSATRFLDDIDSYYDSENDGGYMGSYRKIISFNDIAVAEDVEGVIMTPKNVIIEEGVNVAGIVIAGDRIYIQGNNNIIASPEILREIIKEELHPVNELGYEYMHLHASDFIGDIQKRGIK